MGGAAHGPAPLDDPVSEALDLLHRLNRMGTQAGTPLPAQVTVDGFQPWWFLQESLMWALMVPYTENRELVRRLLTGGAPSGEGVPPAVRELLRRLDVPVPGEETRAAALRGFASKLLRAASRFGLLAVSLTGALFLRFRGCDTLVYVLDQVSPGERHDFRLEGIYSELRRRGYRFAECVHLKGTSDIYLLAWRNLLRRRRPVVFLESMGRLVLGRPYRKSAMPPAPPIADDSPDGPFLLRVARLALRRAAHQAAEIPRLRRMLRWLRIRRIVALDDGRNVNALIAAAKLEGIPSLGYMHGLFNRYHPALLCQGLGAARRHGFDRLGVWSSYFRDRLLSGELYDDDGTFVCGPIRAPDPVILERRPEPPTDNDRVRVLLVSEPRARQDEVAAYIARLSRDDRFRLLIKVRPGEEVPHLQPETAEPEAIELIRGGSVYEAFARCDVVVGTYSSVLYEAILARLPAVVLKTTFSYGHEIVEDGLADWAGSPEEAVGVIGRAARIGQEERKRRCQALWGDAPLDGARHLFDTAESTLWAPPVGTSPARPED